MTIKVYPSLLPGEPIETHEWAGTIAAWFESKDIDYQAQETQPVAVIKGGLAIPVGEWASTLVGDGIEIRLLPHGGVFKGLGNIIGKIFNTLFGWLMPSAGGSNHGSPEQGQKLEVSSAKANQARLGEVVPELAGRFRRFPDYLTPPRRHFVSPREQWLEFHACIGPGHYQIHAADVKIGDTPFSGLGADAAFGIYPPGADLSGVSTHVHWNTVSEVGGTSSGTAGLELPVDMAERVNTQPPQYSLEGNIISRSAGSYPAGWGNETLVFVEYPRLYNVVTINVPETGSAPAYSISEITGYFGHVSPLTIGTQISFGASGATVIYKIRSVSGATVRLEMMTGEPVLIPAGSNQSLIFGADIQRPISVFSEQAITVGGGAFQAGTSSNVRVIFAGGLVYGAWTSTFAACPASETTALLELDFFFPGGLGFVAEDGELQNRTVRAEVQYRNMALGGPFTSATKIYSQATLDQIGFTEQIAIVAMRPEVRVRRVGATSTSTQVQDTIHWYGLKSRLPTRTSYPNWTTMSVRIRSGGKLAAQSENQVNVIATRILPTLQANGTWSVPQPTSDITAFAKYITSSIGYTDDDLVMSELLRLNPLWASRGETFNYVFDETTVKEALNTAFGAGMAELTVDDGQIKPVRDGARTQWEHSYSPQNMTSPLRRSFKAPKHDDADGVEVEYIDGETWAKDVVRCFLPGDQGFKIAKIKIDGVLSRTTAWRIGMRHRRALRYRNWEYSFSTELDALNSGYMSYVPLYDDIPGYGQSAILEAIEPVAGGAMLHVSEPLKWEEGQSHVVGYRRPDGTLAGPWPATPGIDDYSVIANIPQPWPVVTLKMEPPHVYFGTAERWTFPALITDIKPQGLESVNVSATNYDVRVYADDDNFPPN